MRWKGRRSSSNVEDRRGSRGPMVAGGGLGLIAVIVIVTLMGGCGAAVVLRPLPAVVGDRTEWRILLQNLIGNAVKYRHPARLSRVEVSGCAGRDQVWVAVADNGIGIPADQRHLVTRPYARLGPDRGDSHGIGLATCARITAAHGGRLEFADNPGGGTVARITMPARRR